MSLEILVESTHRDRGLYRCLECGLNPTLEWKLVQCRFEGESYHVGFDGKPCGPVMAIPAQPKEQR